jgi:hypothetical protein
MKVKDLVKKLNLGVAAEGDLEREIDGGYASDLLSDVMAQTQEGTVWLTIQTHENIIAVATLNELAAVIITNGKQPTEGTIAKATEQGVNILTSEDNSYVVAGRLYKAGVKGA